MGVAVRNLVAGFHAEEIRKCTAVNDLVSDAFIGQIIEILQKIQPQHGLQQIGFISALSFVIARLNQLRPFLLQDDPFALSKTCALMHFDFF